MNDLTLKLPKIDRSKLKVNACSDFNPIPINDGVVALDKERGVYFDFNNYIIVIEQFDDSLDVLINKLHNKIDKRVYLKTYSYISIQKDKIISYNNTNDSEVLEIENRIKEFYN